MTIVGALCALTAPIIGAVLMAVVWKTRRDVRPYGHMLSSVPWDAARTPSATA